MFRTIPLLMCLTLMASIAAGQDDQPSPSDVAPAETPSEIIQVTLYRDQALVTRQITVPPADGVQTINITDLPELLVPDSAYAEGDETAQVRAVRVSSRPITQSNREEVRELQIQIDNNTMQKTRIAREKTLVKEDAAALEKLVNFTATSGTADLNRGVLNAETVTNLSAFAKEQRKEIADRELALEQEFNEANRQGELLQRKLNEIVEGQRATNYEAKIFVETNPEKAGIIKLSYLVNGCSWAPQYAIRGEVGKELFKVRYSALVQQMSGEIWDGVKLILSTASPSISADGPRLTPFQVSCIPATYSGNDDPFGAGGYGAQAPTTPSDPSMLNSKIQSLRAQQRSAENRLYAPKAKDEPVQRDIALNFFAGEMQQIELQAEAKVAASLAPDAADDVASQIYALEQPVSLDSRREQQLVQIAEAELKGELYHVATPLLSSYVYREAEIINSQPIGLLGGPANIYLDDRFVGRTELPTTASGQRLFVGFGADQQVRTRRELLDKQDETQGGNRRLKFTYRLVISSFKDALLDVRLMDRMPIASKAQEVSVRLDDPKRAISDDPLYQRVQRPRGILRWDLEIPANANGGDAFDVEYSYTLEFDKNRTLATSDGVQQSQLDYPDAYSDGMDGGMGGMGGGMGGGIPAPTPQP